MLSCEFDTSNADVRTIRAAGSLEISRLQVSHEAVGFVPWPWLVSLPGACASAPFQSTLVRCTAKFTSSIGVKLLWRKGIPARRRFSAPNPSSPSIILPGGRRITIPAVEERYEESKARELDLSPKSKGGTRAYRWEGATMTKSRGFEGLGMAVCCPPLSRIAYQFLVLALSTNEGLQISCTTLPLCGARLVSACSHTLKSRLMSNVHRVLYFCLLLGQISS